VLGLEIVVALGVALLLAGALARRFPIAPALLLVLVGVLMGFAPALRRAQLPPEVVLLLFLPALLYWESLTTSLREIRANLRVVVLTSTLLVVATAGAVAATAHALGLPWGPAWVLGAAVAPTDATAVGVLARALPRRTVTVLRAESLVNDGTALVIYGLAVGVTVGEEHLSALRVTWLVVLSYGGGLLAGALVGVVSWQVRRRIDDPILENIAVLVTPFGAFLLAESIHASGVLAVVACGLFMSQLAPRITGAATRQQTTAFWSLATTVLSSVLFVLVGLQAQSALYRTLLTDKRVFGKNLEIAGILYRSGAKFLAGTDTPFAYCIPGFALHDELRWLVKAGLTPLVALQAATLNPAEYLARSDSMGAVEAGKLADLVLLNAVPLADIGNVDKISAVIVGGKVADPGMLLRKVEAAVR